MPTTTKRKRTTTRPRKRPPMRFAGFKLPVRQSAWLATIARRYGITVGEYLRRLIERDMTATRRRTTA